MLLDLYQLWNFYVKIHSRKHSCIFCLTFENVWQKTIWPFFEIYLKLAFSGTPHFLQFRTLFLETSFLNIKISSICVKNLEVDIPPPQPPVFFFIKYIFVFLPRVVVINVPERAKTDNSIILCFQIIHWKGW